MFKMSASYSVQILLYLLPILVNSQMNKYCYKVACGGFKTDELHCNTLGHLEDPFSNKCTPSCDSECVNGYCDFCFCSTRNITTTVTPTATTDCKRIRNPTNCSLDHCEFDEIRNCNHSQFMVNPFHNFECVLRCSPTGSACTNGWCSSLGHCTCYLGYRSDVTDPKSCVKIPDDNSTVLEKVCYKGFKLNANDECVSNCGECKNGCCDARGACQCRPGYKFDVETSNCVVAEEVAPTTMTCSAKCVKGTCNTDNICQCMDCKAFANKSADCGTARNDKIVKIDRSVVSRNCENSASLEDMVSKTTHNTYIGVIVCINLVLIIAVIFLLYVIIMMRKALPQSGGYNMEIDDRRS